MPDSTPLRVMLVDDSKTIRKSGEAMLTAAGCVVMGADDGFDCMAKAKDFDPQFFFIDVMMPRLDGYKVSQVIRNHADLKNVPIVMLSSKDGIFDKAKGMQAGATDYLTKPFNKDDLLNALIKHVPGFKPKTD
ncbi:response regulator [Pseudomonas baetica]|jgi:twitching motility two-component system response regulator PilG|uniref:response regulator n=1 Tax=Pseudomonas baetica TaxID=674054 RepID=UPI00240540A7|nr:response regulator [Pseudomonas baetica]MDF9779130.1 twitching motility two-component system response regulator PilG [Pseudomonas baetica]